MNESNSKNTIKPIIMNANSLAGVLLENDQKFLSEINQVYENALREFTNISQNKLENDLTGQNLSTQKIIDIFERLGQQMGDFAKDESRLQIYSFALPTESHVEVSRLIAKLRDLKTGQAEFIYYIQRAYELLFKLVYSAPNIVDRSFKIVKTPVNHPIQNFAVHKMPNVDNLVKDTVMCVMLRGALLPSMILSKEIQEYATNEMITPFALFRIKRNEQKDLQNMEYILEPKNSYFNPEILDNKDLLFADPMNATGGSTVAVVNYLKSIGIKPKSVLCFNVIASLKGMLQVIRSIENAKVYTLWVDPVLNHKAYIMPGLGDAGDRLNGVDNQYSPREIIQLIADYGANITNLYRTQVREIEKTVLNLK